MNQDKERDYSGIIGLEHHTSANYPHMSGESRAAQFTPFAALTGFSEVLKETERKHEERMRLEREKGEDI